MDGRLPEAVISACSGNTTAMAVFAAIDAGRFTQRDIAAFLGLTEGPIRRAMKVLRELELLHGDSRCGYQLAHVEARVHARAPAPVTDRSPRVSARASARGSRSRAHAGDPLFQEISKDLETAPSATSCTPKRGDATAITRTVWDLKQPHPPAVPFPGVVKIAKRFIEAGYADEDIVRAMVTVPTISTGWVEAELAKHATRRRPAQPVDNDRDSKRGRVKL